MTDATFENSSRTDELSETDLATVSGGMKYDPNTKRDDVIDARGGSATTSRST